MRAHSESYAITTVTFGRRTLFQRTIHAELLVETLFHYRDQGRYALHGFVVMPEHLHLLLTPSVDQSVERCVQCVKGGFSHAIREQFKGEVWQASFHEHRVRDAEDFLNQMEYIARNPERRGWTDYPYVHIRYGELVDEMPTHFLAEGEKK